MWRHRRSFWASTAKYYLALTMAKWVCGVRRITSWDAEGHISITLSFVGVTVYAVLQSFCCCVSLFSLVREKVWKKTVDYNTNGALPNVLLSSLFTRFFFYFLFLSVPVLRLIFLLRKHQKATDQINTPLYQQYIESLCKKYFCFSKEKISKRTKQLVS